MDHYRSGRVESPCSTGTLVQATNQLMIIVRFGLRCANRYRHDARRFDRNCSLILQNSIDPEKLFPVDDQPVFRVQIWVNDDVREAVFIFQAEKHEPLSGSWPLARNDASRHARKNAIRQPSQAASSFDFNGLKILPPV